MYIFGRFSLIVKRSKIKGSQVIWHLGQLAHNSVSNLFLRPPILYNLHISQAACTVGSNNLNSFWKVLSVICVTLYFMYHTIFVLLNLTYQTGIYWITIKHDRKHLFLFPNFLFSNCCVHGEYTGTHSAGQQTKIIQATDCNELLFSIVKFCATLNLCTARIRIQTWLVCGRV